MGIIFEKKFNSVIITMSYKLEQVQKNGIVFSWQNIEDYGTHTGLLASALNPQFPGSSEILRHESFDWCARKKNNLWCVRPDSSFLLRQKDPKGSRPVLRRYADIPGGGSPTGFLPQVQESETGEIEVAGG